MTELASISSVAYKKGNWMRYTLWGLAALCILTLAVTFVRTLDGEISAAVPDGYKFALTDNYADGSNVRTTYYVYDGKILVEDESFESDKVNRAVMVYDGINTDGLNLDPEDRADICELGTCKSQPKVLTTIKKLVSRSTGREYIGL